ncbi:hypothetical protein [Cohnella herbarum]|uniref:Lipoprotein n=1 Tax=Cohnella herbarum TaxID=2728023 RepID=A0A7Z2VMC4_9BACL|nr:hypothetical protein [Cohnella herbarum]QJD85704.1 hypothetical protein HH215_22630 [Cohnella herbarum]
MSRLRISLLLMGCVVLLSVLAGCGGKKDNAAALGAEIEKAVEEAQVSQEVVDNEATIPSDYPQDLPILADDASNIRYYKEEKPEPGGVYFDIGFSTKKSVEEAIQPYRDYIKEKGYKYEEQPPVGGGITATGESPEWGFRLTVLVDNLIEGNTLVGIIYYKPS